MVPASPRISGQSWSTRFHALPKSELHLHLEGTLEPQTVVALARKYGEAVDENLVTARYSSSDFAGFIEAYKWVTSYLRTPADYARAAVAMCERLREQNVVYAEVTLSVGVMLLRKQDVAATFCGIREGVKPYEREGLRLQWIFDAVRQFGPAAAHEVARRAVELRNEAVVAFGLGGDELAYPASEFRDVYEYVGANGLHRLAHAGEIGNAASVADVVNTLGVERIGHGIAAAADPRLVETLAEKSIVLEICPTSNLRTGALAEYTRKPNPVIADHPAKQLARAEVPITLSTDDPAMFGTSLAGEFNLLAEMRLEIPEILKIAEEGFRAAFLPPAEKNALLESFRSQATALGLI